MVEIDVLVIGAGQAAVPLIGGLSGKGLRLALAERKQFGGSCVNFGCTPTKAAIASAKLAYDARRSGEFGLLIPNVAVDFPRVLETAQAVVDRSVKGLTEYFSETADLTVYRNHAKFTGKEGDRYVVEVGDETLLCRYVVLDVGTRTLFPPIPGLEDVDCIHSGNWLSRKTLPRRLAIIGGGSISVEMAQFYHRLGSEVTIIERSMEILPHEDIEVGTYLCRMLEEEGVKLELSASVEKIERADHGIHVFLADKCLVVDDIFLAVGRKMNTDDLGLETIGLAPRANGVLAVDDYSETEAKNLFAVGDIRGGLMLTSNAWDDGRVVLSAIDGSKARTNKRVIPYAVFTDPELGRVGLTETEAKAQGKKYKSLKFNMSHNGLAQERRATKGFVKVLIDEDTDRFLGAAVIGESASETVHLFAAYMAGNLPSSLLRDSVIAHPTFSEAIQNVLL